MRRYQRNNVKRFWRPRNIALGCATLLLLACATVGALEYTNTTYWFHKRPITHETQKNTPNRTIGENTKGEGTSSNTSTNPSTQTQPNTSTTDQNAKSPSDTPTDTTLATPTGPFVNSHGVKVDSAPNTQQSVCVTTSGATCEIIFTNGSTTRSLGAQMTDRGGATYWTWSPQSAGLSVGTWKITAKAVLGSQTKTASDSTNLEVTP